MALSAASCNNYSNSNNKNQETKADTDTISVTISKDTADDKSSQKDESLAKEFILLNPNDVLEESKRAALEAGIYMPETVMNGAKSLCTSSNANPSYKFLKSKMGINTQSSSLPQVGSNYCYAGNYTQNGTKNIVCFFTSAN